MNLPYGLWSNIKNCSSCSLVPGVNGSFVPCVFHEGVINDLQDRVDRFNYPVWGRL